MAFPSGKKKHTPPRFVLMLVRGITESTSNAPAEHVSLRNPGAASFSFLGAFVVLCVFLWETGYLTSRFQLQTWSTMTVCFIVWNVGFRRCRTGAELEHVKLRLGLCDSMSFFPPGISWTTLSHLFSFGFNGKHSDVKTYMFRVKKNGRKWFSIEVRNQYNERNRLCKRPILLLGTSPFLLN